MNLPPKDPNASNNSDDLAKYRPQFARLESLMNSDMKSKLESSTQVDLNEAFKIATLLLEMSRQDRCLVLCSAKGVSVFFRERYGVQLTERSIRDACKKGKAGITPAKAGRPSSDANRTDKSRAASTKPPLTPQTFVRALPTPIRQKIESDNGCGVKTAKKAAVEGYRVLRREESTKQVTSTNVTQVAAKLTGHELSQRAVYQAAKRLDDKEEEANNHKRSLESCLRTPAASSAEKRRRRVSFSTGTNLPFTPQAGQEDESTTDQPPLPLPVCAGIRSSSLESDNGIMLWLAKQLRSLANTLVLPSTAGPAIIEKCNYECMLDGNHFVEYLNATTLSEQGLIIEMKRAPSQDEDAELVLRSTTCTGSAASLKSTRCAACKKAKPPIAMEISRLVNYSPPVFNWNTKNEHLASSPRRAEHYIVSLKQMVKIRERKICQLLVKQRDLKLAVKSGDPKVGSMVKLAVDTALPGVQEKYGDDSPEHNLFRVFRNHLMKYGDTGKHRGIRFDPALFQFAVAICSKTSHSVYNQIAKVMMLPDLSYVLRKQKENTEKQSGSCFGVRHRVIKNIHREFNSRGINTGANQRLGAISFDSMVIGRDGLCLDFHSGNFVGLDPTLPFDTMTRNFESMAASAAKKAEDSLSEEDDDALDEPATLEEANAGELLDRLENIAKHHMIFKWTSIDPAEKVSRIVSSSNLADLKPSSLRIALHSLLIALHLNDLAVCVLVGDGAKENTKMFDDAGTEEISSFIPKELQDQFQACCDLNLFESKLVMKHPCTHDPLFILEDMPHVMKRVVNAMEKSSQSPGARDLRWGNDSPMNLSMVRQVWECIGGRTTSLQVTKFTTRHFFKDQNDRMRCNLCFQILSRSCYYMIQDARQDVEMELPLETQQCERLLELIDHGNTLTDTCNGRLKFYPVEEGSLYPKLSPNDERVGKKKSRHSQPEYFTATTGCDMQRRLLGILEWFSQWKRHVGRHPSDDELRLLREQCLQDAARKGEATPEVSDSTLIKQFVLRNRKNFFADATWNGIRRLVLGMVGLIQHYSLGEQHYQISPRRLSSDPCEHHFCETRQSMGGQSGGTALLCNAMDNKTDAFAQASAAYSKGNCANAPQLFKELKSNY